MRVTKLAAFLIVLAPMVLCAIQAGVWIKSTSHVRSETDIQNRESRHRPSEIAGVAGMLLLLGEATVLSIPRNDDTGA